MDPDDNPTTAAPDAPTIAPGTGGGPDAGAPPVRQLIGGYEVLSVLGQGGMGVVYKARQRALDRVVALKMILTGAQAGAEDLVRFKTEAEAVARLQHPGIVQVFEVGEHEGRPFFSLEFVEGGSLASRLDGTPWHGPDAARLVLALARAMQHAHEHGIVHRDLKPANILLAADDAEERRSERESGVPLLSYLRPSAPSAAKFIPKITDFGLAKRLGDTSGQTQAGSILGTPSYMAPEQAGGRSQEAGPLADVYALGAILYELLTGRPPFRAATPWDTVLQVITSEPVAPRLLSPKTSRDLETICLKCLEKDPHRRYASAGELAADLQRFLDDEPIHARPAGAPEKLWRWCRRHPARAAVVGVSLLGLLTAFAIGAWFNHRLSEQLDRNEQARRELELTLTRQMAERLDADLRQLAGVPRMMAATLSQRPDWTEEQLAAWMRTSLEKEPRIFGTCVAFEPGRFDAGHRDYALYAHRDGKGAVLKAKKLLPPDYTPLYREWDWYTRPKRERQASWSEPFVDVGGGDIPMLTYSVPLFRDGQFVGVVTADLSVDYFRVLRQWLGELSPGRDGYGFVVSPSGTFISHPDVAYRMPKKITEVAAFQADERLRELAARLMRQETGSLEAVDPATGRPASFYFAPVPSAGWMFVAVVGAVPQERADHP